MDQEIEVKFLLKDYSALMQKISDLQLPCSQERIHEFNLRYDLPDGSLVAQKQVLRLRKDTQARLTFKGPGIMEEDVLLRKEIEVVVSDFDATNRLLQALGYQVIMMYEKFRANYLMDKLVLSVDETPLGLFIELEGESPAQVRWAADALGLDWDARINLSYSALLNIFNQSTGHTFRDLNFENFAELDVTPSDLGLSFAD
ncbi:MAG: class IV adenylate cyclase [Anaerolineaceae bacterium]|jgi:adenylate cyclase class 2|nr:class IV adenylate cyclase [Anaerolineaceae bacterium]